MKYSTVEIKPSRITNDKWEVSFTDLDGERKDEGHRPHWLGFYHYPRCLGKKKAFEELKELLIAKHVNEIATLSKSLERLKVLQIPAVEQATVSHPSSKRALTE